MCVDRAAANWDVALCQGSTDVGPCRADDAQRGRSPLLQPRQLVQQSKSTDVWRSSMRDRYLLKYDQCSLDRCRLSSSRWAQRQRPERARI